MISKIFEIYLIKFCIYDWFVLLHLALSVFVTTTFFPVGFVFVFVTTTFPSSFVCL